MDIKCLKKFKNFNEINQFSKPLEQLNWKIEKQLLKDRAIKYSNMEIFRDLKKRYIENEISIFELKDEEVITWLDTLLLLRRLFLRLYTEGFVEDNIMILMEYPFLYGNYMRADYVFLYENSIITVEFGMFNQDEKRKQERYTKKVQEVIGHKHTLENMLPKEINVFSYVMMYRPEYDRVNNRVFEENCNYNNNEILKLANFVIYQVNKQKKLKAISVLESFESQRL